MQTVLLYLIIGVFAALLFLNVYFRVKVLKLYKYLVQNRVDFKTRQIFNREIIEQEVISKYPQHRLQITQFVNHIKYSMNIAILLIVLITLFGGVLMYFRN